MNQSSESHSASQLTLWQKLDTMKRCASCKQWKLFSEFDKCKKHKTGLQHRCRECMLSQRKEAIAKRRTRQVIPKIESKRCAKCKKKQPGGNFTKNMSNPDGLEPYCKKCDSTRHREATYGITGDQFHKMIEDQKRTCPICKDLFDEKRKIASMDHSHLTGLLRDVLCRLCNTGIGNLGDSPEILETAAAYLRAWNKRHEEVLNQQNTQ